jgi:hypothetical protein
MKEKLETFFGNLSHRLYSENNLSDITWALLETEYEFRSLFLNFFFQYNCTNTTSKIEVFREFSEVEGSRPDFYFKTNEKDYVVEVKKYDRNYHFEQYKEAFPKASQGFISIYNIPKIDNVESRTWKEFYEFIVRFLTDDSIDKNNKILFESYLVYLKNTCDIFNIKTMKLTNLDSLYHFNMQVEEIINEGSNEKFEANIYDSSTKPFLIDRSGRYFSLKHKKTGKVIYPWFGIYYGNYVRVYTGFKNENGWCIDFTKKIIDNLSIIKNEYITEPYEEDNFIFIGMNDEIFNEFNKESTTINEQKDILKKYFNIVLNIVDDHL